MTFEEMKYEIYTNGPMTVSTMSGKKDCFSHGYKSGIIKEDPASNYTTTNHAMTIVGYGVENGTNYLVIRNNWGDDWGENGYGKLAFGSCFMLNGWSSMVRPHLLPKNWTCEGGNQRNVCDCDCGAIDPDCTTRFYNSTTKRMEYYKDTCGDNKICSLEGKCVSK